MKLKIILTNLVVVLLVGFASHVYLQSALKSKTKSITKKDIKADRKAFQGLLMLRGYQLMAEVQRKSSSRDASKVFDPLPPDEKKAEQELRARAYIMVDKYAVEELKFDPLFGRKPELVAITNPRGIVIARDTDANANVGENWGKKYDLVKFALNRRAKWDIIKYNDMYLQAAASPIIRDEGIVGCLLAAFELDNGFMNREGESLGSNVGVIIKGEVYASSFNDEAMRKRLAATLLSKEKGRVKEVLSKNRASELFNLELSDERFITAIAPLPGQYQIGKVGFVIIRSLDEAFAPLKHLWFIVGFTLFGALLVILVGILLGAHFIRPIETLEAEIRRVIEGDYEHRWEVKSSEVGGLSYLINQMLDVITGEEEEEQEEEEEEKPKRERAKTEEEFMREGEASSMSIEDILNEPEDQYYKRLYNEFRGLKTKISEDPDAIPFDAFVAKLKETEKNILASQQGSAVRFQVQLQGSTISYKPIISP